MPVVLPRHVYLVVSTLSGSDVLTTFEKQTKVTTTMNYDFLELNAAPGDDAATLLDRWMTSDAGRRLTDDQRRLVLAAFDACPTPLYLRTVYHEARRWTSDLAADNIRLGASTVRAVAAVVYGRLERDHGEMLTRRTLGYLTAARNGLTFNELEDVLALDDAVMDDIHGRSGRPTLRRLPPALLVRLVDDLDGDVFLDVDHWADGATTMVWRHEDFRAAAEERYLKQRDKAPSYHRALAEYFADLPSAIERHVTGQPLYWDTPEVGVGYEERGRTAAAPRGSVDVRRGQRIYNHRRLNEHPFHLLWSQQLDRLKAACLCNYEFLLARISSGEASLGLQSLLDDIDMVLNAGSSGGGESSDADLDLLRQTVCASTDVLTVAPAQLASQLVGRLQSIVDADVPKTSKDPRRYPFIKTLLDGILRTSVVATAIPSTTCLLPPTAIYTDRLQTGIPAAITALATSPDGLLALSASSDDTVRVWDLPGGRLVKTIAGVGRDVREMRFCRRGATAFVAAETRHIRMWSVEFGSCLQCLGLYSDPATITTATCDDGRDFVVAFFHGSRVMRVWYVDNSATAAVGAVLVRECLMDDGPTPGVVDAAADEVLRDATSLTSLPSGGPFVLHAYRNSSLVTVHNICKLATALTTAADEQTTAEDPSKTEVVATTTKKNATTIDPTTMTSTVVRRIRVSDSSSLTALAVTHEYFLCATRHRPAAATVGGQSSTRPADASSIEVFEIEDGRHLRSVKGCCGDMVRDLHVNVAGSHASTVCWSSATNVAFVAVWNVETEDHKHLARHRAAATPMMSAVDLRFVLTATANSPIDGGVTGDDGNAIRVWNLREIVKQKLPKERSREGVARVYPVENNQRYVVVRPTDGLSLDIWNLWTTTGGRSRPVLVHREKDVCISGGDVVLVRNSTVVVLSNKRLCDVGDDEVLAFHTVRIFDIKNRKYRHSAGAADECTIFAAPEHEYVLLDDDGEQLMGPSETRSHFIVWNLVTGAVLYRIKTGGPRVAGMARDLTQLENELIRGGTGGHPPMRFNRMTTAHMAPWVRRTETQTAKCRRHDAGHEAELRRLRDLRLERSNSIDRFLVSADRSTIVADFYAHHLAVFDVRLQRQVQTIETDGAVAMLHLYVAALTADGRFLVHVNYNDVDKVGCLTLWECRTGVVKRRLRGETGVCAVAIADDGERVVFGKVSALGGASTGSTVSELCIWNPSSSSKKKKSGSVTRIGGHSGWKLNVETRISLTNEDRRAIVFAGDVSFWDVGERPAPLAVFTPDSAVRCLTLALAGKLIVVGFNDVIEPVTLRLAVAGDDVMTPVGEDVYGEVAESDDEGPEDDDDDI